MIQPPETKFVDVYGEQPRSFPKPMAELPPRESPWKFRLVWVLLAVAIGYALVRGMR